MKNKWFQLFQLFQLFALMLITGLTDLAYSAPSARDFSPKPATSKTTGVVANRPVINAQQLGGGSNNSKISNITITAQSSFYTGTVAYVNWSWPGNERGPVDFILNNKKLNTDGPWTRGPQFPFIIPHDLDQREYGVTVRSAYNPSIQAHGRFTPKSSYIIAGKQPEKDIYYIQGSLLRTEWTYLGNPGPVKLELFQTYNSTPIATIRSQYGPGNFGSGSFNWMIPANIPSGKYYIAITSLASSKLSVDSQQFYIGKEPAPVLKSLTPSIVQLGPGRVTVLGTNLNYMNTYKAYIVPQNGKLYEATTGNYTATQFDLTNIPDIYKEFNSTAQNSQHRQSIMQPKLFYVKKNQTESNRLLLTIKSPYPILDKLSNDTVYPGNTIIVYGGNWEFSKLASYYVEFHLPGGNLRTRPIPIGGSTTQAGIFPNQPNVVYTGAFSVKIPDVFANKSTAEQNAINTGTMQMSIFGPGTLPSNKLDIKLRKNNIPTTPKDTCPAYQSFSDYTYVGQPSCSGTDTLQCNEGGLYCRASGGSTYPAACTKWGSGVGSDVELLIRNGIVQGCYRKKIN